MTSWLISFYRRGCSNSPKEEPGHVVDIEPDGPEIPGANVACVSKIGPEIPAPKADPPESIEIDAKWLPLYKATLAGDWKKAEVIFNQDTEAIKSSITFTTETALHVAIGTGKAINFVQNLVDRTPIDLLGIPAKDGITPLHVAALAGNTKAAKMLVAKCPHLVYKSTTTGLLPLHFAAEFGHRETLAYLISKTQDLHDVISPNPYTAQSGLKLLFNVIDAGFYDVALDLAEKYPDLAKLRDEENRSSALEKIAGKVYVLSRPRRQYFSGLTRFIYSIPGVNAIVGHNKVMIREKAQELVKCLCENIKLDTDDTTIKSIYSDAMMEAIDSGTSEAIEVILAAFPETIITTMGNREPYIFGRGVENRCEIVFHLISQTSSLTGRRYLGYLDYEKNNILHRTAKLAPKHKLNLVTGAALQMQREMQWYKEVENLLTPHIREQRNMHDKSPKMIFIEEHAALQSEGEKWMKETANSCSIAAALIATIVFAAAITVPGGNKDESGTPFFSDELAFIIFAFSDAISLFASVTSLLMFVSILTSRYAEEDFLHALPKRLIIGLLSLFNSILCMMVAFGATLYIMFGQNKPWIIIPVVVLGGFPVTSFVLLQSPLLLDVISNTYGSGKLGNQIKRHTHVHVGLHHRKKD